MSSPDIEVLASRWLAAKEKEDVAKAARLEVEAQILADATIVVPHEGTTKIGPLTIRTDYSRKWDPVVLEGVHASRPNAWPFRSEWKEVRAESRIVERDHPTLWSELAEGLTLTPKKPYFAQAKKR